MTASYCSYTGVKLAISGHKMSGAEPVRGGTSLFRTSDGLIREGIDFTPIYPSCKLPELAKVLSIYKEGKSFKAFVEDRFSIYQQTWKLSPCNEDCHLNLNAARENVWSFIDFESCLEFSVKDVKKAGDCSLHLIITDLTQQAKVRVMVLDMQWHHSTMKMTFSPKDRCLIVQDHHSTMVYEMPRTYSDAVSLVSVQDAKDIHFTCVHERSYFRSSHQISSSLLKLKKDQLAVVAPALFRLYLDHISDNGYIQRCIN